MRSISPITSGRSARRASCSSRRRLTEHDVDHLAVEGSTAQVRRRVEHQQLAIGQQADVVAERRFADVLGRDEQRAPFARHVAELGPELLAQDRVDAGGRLVEEDVARVVDEGRREGKATLHATRRVAHALAPVVGQLDPVEQLTETLSTAQRQAVHRGVEVQVLPHGQIAEQSGALREVADPRPLLRRHLVRRHAVEGGACHSSARAGP